MSTTATNGYGLDYWLRQANRVLAEYADDIEIAHVDEDSLLEKFVCAVADGLVPDPRGAARVLFDGLLDRPRTRWYA